MSQPLTEQQLDEITERAAGMFAHADLGNDEDQREAERLSGQDVPDLVAEIRRQRRLLPDLAGRWEQLADQGDAAVGHFEGPAAAILDAEVGERGRTYRKAAADVRDVLASGRIPHDLMTDAESRTEQNTAPAPPDAPLAASQPSEAPVEGETATRASTGRVGGPRRTLTPNEYDAAWHAVEGAAGDEGADPGTVLHAVLNRLGIEWQDAARPAAAEEVAR